MFSPSARSPFGRRPFNPDDPVNLVRFSFKDENLFLFFCRILNVSIFDQTGLFSGQWLAEP
ncbi:hypothetical protein D1AOALGA4SA_750 [Olavius algarvensis Delta 1 endosymbiont]|nr:hypothetical protein D1AOALGA4SA_750 [Olavius algarvensis Delta 1 endosymbiont]